MTTRVTYHSVSILVGTRSVPTCLTLAGLFHLQETAHVIRLLEAQPCHSVCGELKPGLAPQCPPQNGSCRPGKQVLQVDTFFVMIRGHKGT